MLIRTSGNDEDARSVAVVADLLNLYLAGFGDDGFLYQMVESAV
jgi:hypothetical protein